MAGEAGGGAASGMYAQAMVGVIDLLMGASQDAAYDAAYGPYYRQHQEMHNAANRKVAAEANINAIRQDRINTDAMIAIQQDTAEAQAKVMAAASGVEGQSVNDVIYQTEFNSSVAKSNSRKHAEQNIENQLAEIYQSQSTLLASSNNAPASPNMGLGLAAAGTEWFMAARDSGAFENLFGAGESNGGTSIDTSGTSSIGTL